MGIGADASPDAGWHLPPWTPEEVNNINTFQSSGAMHPFTCGCGPEDGDDHFGWPNRILIARNDGLHCPNARCPVQTTHVERDITDGSLLRSIQQAWPARSATSVTSEQDDWDF